MWILTQDGFYSVVAYSPERDQSDLGGDDGDLLVRARTERDLGALRTHLPTLKIRRDESADYRFRTVVKRDEWVAYVSTAVRDLDYVNFKGRVAACQGSERARIYGRVWAELHQLQGP
jgi:hypothetical protein